MDYLLETAIAAAKEAGRIQLEYLDKEHDISYKGEVDLVTEVDRLCEREIVSIINERFPDHDILAEEERTSYDRSSDSRWIIDPLDGTTNYAHGYRCFCTSIAYEKSDEIVLGVIYDPVADELFYAEKGHGALLNDKSISASKTDNLIRSLLCTGFPYDKADSERNNLDLFKRFLLTTQAVRRDGAAALDLCYVAAGRFDGFWELKLRPWDMAAGVLIVQEAGGKVTNLNGDKLDIFRDDLVASNGIIHEKMIKITSGR